ncbi:siderophore ABC transporter substrate-binding protein [Cellulosimicrobium protaetiae]|uniref:ABC transporter substrate-binding protein n=1 Tax=Cellulosimicrobium protaetiae TaxID=2587808 RepID=A0A6M5UDY0_9MICO|nr:ABC transporter substrate-binding protein [Cellulosimicrobium protaetiae]QJW34899.1 ABC transporter substrate-binding protein [Cellulosimicrobium protaetiae]
MPSRTTNRRLVAVLTAAPLALALAACSSGDESVAGGTEETAESAPSTVTIEDNHGSVEVPVNPERVVALDNHVFETLSAWEVPLVAAPKGIMGDGLWPEYTEDDAVLDVGMHREPNLESIVAAEPDLIIGGYRFSDSYDDIKAQNPDAVVVELAPRDGEDQSSELVRQIEILGQIFDREDAADAIVADYEAAVADAKDAYDGESTVVGLITSGGEISYSAPVTGRSIGTLFPTLGLEPAIEQAAEDTSHGDDISVEAIAAANPDWIVVLDRDGAGVGEGEYRPASELIGGSEALAGVTAVAKGQVVYLDPDFYLTEDIQAYTALYEQIAQAFSGAA